MLRLMWIEKMPTCIGNNKTTLLEQQHSLKVTNLFQSIKKYGISRLDFQTIEKDPLKEI